MATGCMRCNKEGCGGLVVYEDADYDYREAILDGSYTVDSDDEEHGDVEELEHACITEWLRKHDSRKDKIYE